MYGQRLAELVMEAAFPPGVINILCGIGSVAGQALADHREVRKISFTGITVVGRQLLATSSKTNLKKSLESGQVTANMWGTVNVNTPFGGVKETGFGRNLGRDALDEWTHVKCIKFQVSNL
ncbi:hypothetical protein BHE90_015323 [Fusarium euwallaceae]|uniref:aldehyde dehydrogenase (NAD(+)) n=1 Tax=Fusarium euwallaceae TaxID=1147111 RepID=A0A430L3J2_9HYPO|nr:hypothetical protein BHE90_015323 [Fusarium euwallaceae]